VGQDEVLHLLRADLLAAPVDQVLDPALDHVVAGRRLGEQVAGAVEAVRGERAGIVLGRAEVAAQRVRAADDQLAGLAVRHHVPVLVHQVDLVVGGGGPAARFPPYSGRIRGPNEHDQALGHAEVLLDETPRQGAFRAQPDLRLQPLPAALDHPQRGQVVLGDGRVVDPPDQQRGHQVDVRHPVPLDQLEDVPGPGARAQHDGPAAQKKALQAWAAERQVVLDREHVQQHVALADLAHRRGDLRVVQVVVVGPGDELGDPGGPAGKQEQRRVGRIDADGGQRLRGCPRLAFQQVLQAHEPRIR